MICVSSIIISIHCVLVVSIIIIIIVRRVANIKYKYIQSPDAEISSTKLVSAKLVAV